MHESFISQLYQNILGREPDASGLAFWQEVIEYGGVSAAKMTEQFISSTEYRVFVQPVAQLYFVSFNRAPEADGLGFWIEALREGATLNEIAVGFEASDEFQSQYGQMTNEEFIIAIYQNSLRREPDESGQAYWLEQLSGGMTRAGVLSGFSESLEMTALRAQEVDFALLYLALTGVPPTMAMIQQAVPIRDWAELIESIYTGPDYVGPDVPGLVRFEGPEKPEEPPAETPDEPPVDSSPEPDPGPAPDTTPPSILGFTLASPTTLSVTSSESGSAALFREARFPDFPDEVIPATEIEIANAGQAYPIVVSPDEGETFLKLADRSGNVIKSDILVELLGNGVDNFDYGGAVPKFIFGFGGNDWLSAGTGDDFLIGGDNDDTLTGGLGNDTFLIDSGTDEITDLSNSDVFIIHAGAFLFAATISGNYLATAASQNMGGSRDNAQFVMASGVTLANFAEMTVVSENDGGVRIDAHALTAATITGSSGSDSITGSSAADSLVGGAGADILNGGDGDDTITGGAGNDTISGDNGNDTITGGAGADILTGGDGDDAFIYTAVADLFTGDALVDSITGGTGTDTLRMDVTAVGYTISQTDSWNRANTIEVLSHFGANANNIIITLNADAFTAGLRAVTMASDTDVNGRNFINAVTAVVGQDLFLIGSAGVDDITGGAGNDIVVGGAGDDLINAEGGANVVTDAGMGLDVIRHTAEHSTVAVAVTGSDPVVILASQVGASVTIAHDIRARVDASFSTAGVRIDGGDGNDSFNGGLGNDTITGGAGADLIDAKGGADVVTDAGVGNDYIMHSTAGATVAIAVMGSDTTIIEATETGATATIANGVNGYVNAHFSTAAVRLNGGDGNDSLEGGSGNDILNGAAGNDTIDGGLGADVINAGAGDNRIINVGNGADVITHDATGSTVSVAIVGTDLVTLTAQSLGATILMLQGSSNARLDASSSSVAIAVEGNSGDESITAGSGNDTINAYGGNDTITGGAGADSLTGGDGADRFVYSRGSTGLTFDTADTITDFKTGEDVIATSISPNLMVYIIDGVTITTFDRFIDDAGIYLGAESWDVFVVINAGGSGNAWVAVKTNHDVGNRSFGEGDSIIILDGIDNVNKISNADFIT